MQIMWLKLKGYCRFKDEVTLNLSGKLVALLGSNEAGKTSILRALQNLSTDAAMNKDDIYKTSDENPEETYLKARFSLNLDEISQAKLVKNSKLEIHKSHTGSRELTIVPEPKMRDISLRIEMATMLEKVIQNEVFIEKLNEVEPKTGEQKFTQYLGILKSTVENLTITQLNQYSTKCLTILKSIELDSFSENIKSLDADIKKLLEVEKIPSPTEYATNILKGRLPVFLLFGDEDRQLQFQYSVGELSKPSRSLQTLASLSELDLNKLVTAINNDDSARTTTLMKRANVNLKGIFDGKWSQSALAVELTITNKNLQILLDEGGDLFTELKRRSDGFRQFLALIAFVSLKHSENENIILLIDEIESHLHYDGQADLLQTFAKQNFVKKIIYSTHSVGCFPEDLGGIKIIERTPDSFTSKIENKFWNFGNGFAPLLPKIGAQQLAFLPLRSSVIVEGPMDMLLLPVIFKEAISQWCRSNRR